MALNAQFAATPKIGQVALVATADASLTSPVTAVSGAILTGATLGTRVNRIQVVATATTTAGVVRLFLHNGTTFAGLIADNEHQKLHIKVLELIKKYGEISNARFIRATKYLTPKLRSEIINDLYASGEVVKVEVGQTFNLKYNQ